ncbi:MAG: hypothetical protein J1F32_07370, partial [Erysipelotrichales bacterium]|nr:hypothetical protein [Erysipelotrichales bacterium]
SEGIFVTAMAFVYVASRLAKRSLLAIQFCASRKMPQKQRRLLYIPTGYFALFSQRKQPCKAGLSLVGIVGFEPTE